MSAVDETADGASTSPDEPPRWTLVAAYALCTDDRGRVLLVRAAAGEVDATGWTLPGGGLEFGEDPADGALRELTEETGLTGEIKALAFVDSRTGPARPERAYGPFHKIRVVYRVVITGGDLQAEIDGSTDDTAWVPRAATSDLHLLDLATAALRFLDGE